MKFKKVASMLLALSLIFSLVVPTQAATTQMSYGYTLKCQYADRFQTFVSRATCTIQVPRGATKEEILKLIEDWVEDNVVIDQYDLHFGSLKDCVIRSESCWDPDYKDCVILYVGGGSVWAHNNRYLLTDPLSEDYPIPGTCMFDNAPYCAGDIQDSRVLNPFDESYRQDLIARGQKIAGLNITYAGRRYRLETSRSTIGSWASAGDSRYFSTRYGINHYYVRDPISCTVASQLMGSVPPGIVAPASTPQADGEYTAINAAATAAGYDFSGWSTADTTVSGSGFTMPTHNVTFTGSYTPRTDTPYTVKFYAQNANDNGYTEQTADTVTSKGTTDTQIRAALDMAALDVKYPHCHLTDASKADTTVISGDGTAVLSLYYERQTSNVSYIYSGAVPAKAPNAPAAALQKYGASVSVAASPTLSGYDFSGWSSPDAIVANDRFTMPDGPVTLVGSWTPRTDTPYIIERYQQNADDDGYTLSDTDHCIGTTDAAVTAPEKSYTGFTVTPGSMANASSTKIAGDGTTTVKLYYDRNVNAVSYTYSSQTDVTPPSLPAVESYRYGQTVVLADNPALAGYDFGGWSASGITIANGSFTMPDGPVTLVGSWTPRTDTPYTVEYYQQNTDNDDYTLADTFTGKGTTGGGILHKEFVGFTETPDSVTAEGNAKIKSDGTTLLKLYYDRNIETVTYTYSGETDTTPPEPPEVRSYRYGQMVTPVEASPMPGYDFSGWSSSDVSIQDGSFTMPDGSVTLVGSWTPRTDTAYTVEYYQQNLNDDGYTLANTFTGKGTTGGGVLHKEFVGFTETPDSVTAEGNAKIKSDGTTLLKLYYDRNIETVTYAYSGETDAMPPELPRAASYRVGQSVRVADAPTLPGYDFDGWSTSDATIADGSFTMPDAAVVLTGAWATRTDIPYTVEYYWQNAADDDYTLADTFRGKGSVGGSIPHKEFEGFTETPGSVTAEGSTKIKSDGSTLVKLYYDRDRYLVSFAYYGTAPNAAPTLPESTLYRFGTSVTLPAISSTVSGMSFSGWTADGGKISGNILSVPAQDTQVTGTWKQISDSGDVPEATPVEAVTLEDNGSPYIIGYEDGTFRPDAYLTAKHEALMLSRLGLPVTPLSGGTDMLGTERYITRREFLCALLDAAGAIAEPAADPMAQAAALGWISGYTNGELYPNAYITRAQAVVIINRAFGRVAALDLKTDIIYVDLPQDYWAYDAIMAASNIF